MITTDHYIRYHRVDSVAEHRDRRAGRAAPRAVEDRRGAPGRGADQDQPRRGFRRDPDVRGVRRPAGRAGAVPVEHDRRSDPGGHRRLHGLARARPVPDRRAPQRRYAGDRDRGTTPTAGTGRTRPSTTPSPSGAAAGRRTRSSGWARSPAGTTARAATSPCGTPMCSARARPLEFTRDLDPDDPRGDRLQRGVRPLLRQHPVLLPPGLPGRNDGRILCGQRISRRVRVLPDRGVPDLLRRRPVHRVRLRRPGHAGASCPRTPGSPAAPRRRRCGRSAITSAAGSTTPQTRWSRSPRQHRELRRALRRALAGHRVHGRLPGLHLERRPLPGPARRCWSGWPSRASG